MAAELLHDIQYIVNQVFHEITAKYHNIYRTPPWRILGINTSSWLILYDESFFILSKLQKVHNIAGIIEENQQINAIETEI